MSMSADTNPCNEGKIETSQSKITKSGFKPSEYGLVPNDWDVCKLGEIAHIYSGGTPNRKVPEYWDGQIPWVTTTLIDGVTIDNALEFISEKGVEFSSTRWCKAGTLLMAMYGQGKTRGKVGMLGFDATINQACAAIDLKDKESSKYIFHVLNSMYDKIRESSNSGGQENLSGSIIKGLSVPLPPKEEQTAIANALSDVDALIQELEKLIAKKQAIKTATMQQLLTGRTCLPQFAHHPDGRKKGYKPSELGEIPEDWKVVQINQCTDLITKGTTPMTIGKAFVPQGITFVKVESINESGQLDFTKFAYIDEETDKLLARSRIKENDLLISIAGALGRAAIVKHEILPANTNQALAIVRLNKDSEISLNFLYHFTKTTLFKKCIDEIASQGAQPNLSLGDLGAFKIVAPNLKEQKIISDMLSDMDEEIQALEQRLKKNRQIKQGMMQELLTGRIRLVQPLKGVTHD